MYKEYEQKMERLARVLKIVKRVLIVLAIVVPAILLLFFCVGFQYRAMSCNSVVYGEEPNPKAHYTTIGDITYEYRPAGAEDSAWSTEVPTLVGEYEVRASLVSALGVKKESTTKFEIRPKQLDIRLDEITVYDDPHTGRVTADDYEISGLEFDDRIQNVRVQIDESGSDTYLNYHLEDLRIVHADGTDAMDCYVIPEKVAQIKDARVNITVAAGSRSMMYDGDPDAFRDYDVWKITSGAIKSGHTAEFHCESTDVGQMRAINKIVSGGIKDEDGNSVDYQYNIEYEDGELEMTQRTLFLTSGSATKWYDGTPLTNPDYSIKGDGIAEGDTLDTQCLGTITEPGKEPNRFGVVTIASERFGNVKKYYDIKTEEGILKVLLRVDAPANTDDSVYIGYGDGPGVKVPDEPGRPENGEEVEPVTLEFDEDGYPLPGSDGTDPSEGSTESSSGDPSGDSNNNPRPRNSPSSGMPSDNPQKVFSFYAFSNRIYYFKLFSYGVYTGDGFAATKGEDDFKPWNEYLMGNAVMDSGLGYRDIVRVTDLALEYTVYPYFMTTDLAKSEDSKMYTCETYFAWSYPTYPTSSDPKEKDYRDFVHSSYLDVPSNVKEKLKELGTEAGLREGDPNLIDDIAEYIKNAAYYSFDFNFPPNEDMVLYFLTEGKKGICQHYAAAATLMYRTYGIPARYVVGYAEFGSPGRWTTMTTNCGHAWVEIYIDGSGWFPVEVTGQPKYEDETQNGEDPQYSEGEEDDEILSITIVYDRYKKVYDGRKGETVVLNGHLYSGRLRSGDKLSLQSVEVKDEEVLQRVGDNYFEIPEEAIVITDRSGNDVTSSYIIGVAGPRYIVEARPLSIIVYGDYGDDNSLWRMKRMQWSIADGSLAPGHKLDVYCDDRDSDEDSGFAYTLGNVGDYKICAKILDEDGNNVTYNYDLYSPIVMDSNQKSNDSTT